MPVNVAIADQNREDDEIREVAVEQACRAPVVKVDLVLEAVNIDLKAVVVAVDQGNSIKFA